MNTKLNKWADSIDVGGVILMELCVLAFAFFVASLFPTLASLHWEWYIGVAILLLIFPTLRFWGTKSFSSVAESWLELGMTILGLGLASAFPNLFAVEGGWWIYFIAFAVLFAFSPYRHFLTGLKD